MNERETYYLHLAIRYVLIGLLILTIWTAFEKQIIGCFDLYILPILDAIKRNKWNVLLMTVLCVCCIWDLIERSRTRYVYNHQLIFGIIWCVIIVGYYRYHGLYRYEPLFWEITFVDILLLIGAAYILSAIVHWAKVSEHEDILVNAKKYADTRSLLMDVPIETIKEDELDWPDELKKVLQLVQTPVGKRSLSIGINASWGAGKTSFLNIVRNSIDRNIFDVVYFNPRDSKSLNEIQEDYFQQLISVLSVYDGRAKYLIRRYMAALQIIDDSSWLYKLLNVYNEWRKNSIKKEIADICENLPKKILVIIDDFDRLRPEEIQEILKLLDSNASFANFVYLTAYDKRVVCKILADYNHSTVANYTDKYFELEYELPPRPYGYIRDYLTNKMATILQLEEAEKQAIYKLLVEKESLFKTLLSTIRDVKRLINLLSVDYPLVKGEVYFREYFCVHVIKYKYPDEYKSLSLGEYLEDNILKNFDGLFLRKEIAESKEIKSLPILNLLFTCDDKYVEPLYRHIYQKQSFENYFFNKLYGSLMIKEMMRIFEVDYEGMRTLVDVWLENEQQANDFSDYLLSRPMNGFESIERFMKFVTAATYFATKSKGNHGSTVLSRLLFAENVEGFVKKYALDIETYKAHILKILSDDTIDPVLSVLRQYHYFYKEKAKKEEGYILSDSDIWPIIKQRFLDVVENQGNVSEIELYSYLQHCIDHLDKERKIVLDRDCSTAYRSHITENPDYYVGHFVRLVMESTDPEWNMIGCEPFWEQIFGSVTEVKQYAETCKSHGVEYSDRMLNFAELFEANGCQPWEYQHQGPVQAKIDANLVDEINALHALKNVEHRFLRITKEKRSKDVLRDELSELKQEVDATKLPVYYRVDLSNKIGESQRQLG